jgi:hypothetical protein
MARSRGDSDFTYVMCSLNVIGQFRQRHGGHIHGDAFVNVPMCVFEHRDDALRFNRFLTARILQRHSAPTAVVDSQFLEDARQAWLARHDFSDRHTDLKSAHN